MLENKKENKTFYLGCECHSHGLVFEYYDWGDKDADEDIFISHVVYSFYANQQPTRTYIKRMFKMIWCAISGKEYSYFDIDITKDKLEEFKKWVAEL
jgi:hypothetical protein